MAKFTPGSIVSQVSGKVAGVVFSRGRAKAQVRIKKTTHRKNFKSKATNPQRVVSLARRYRAVTAALKTRWEQLAASVPFHDRFGNVYYLSGMQMYVKVNALSALTNIAINNTPPSTQVYPLMRTLTITATTTLFRITYAPTPVPAGTRMLVYASRPLSPGISACRPTEYLYLGFINTGSNSPANLTTSYTAKHGALTGKAGEKIFVRVQYTSTTRWLPGVSRYAIAIVT